MSLPFSPPASTVYSVDKGDNGWPVYACQASLNSLRTAENRTWARLTLDGAFGDQTESVVKAFQFSYKLLADGKFGPASQAKVVERLGSHVHRLLPEVPDGLIRGMAEGEGGNNLAAVNWQVIGGVDCGVMQYRVYGPPYDFGAMQSAFNPLQSMVRAAQDFLGRVDLFYDAAGVRSRTNREEFAKRLAVLAHNWPAGARDIAYDGVLSNPNGPASWVAAGVKFPDGTPVRTRLEWCQFYALGGPHGKASIPKYVTDWS